MNWPKDSKWHRWEDRDSIKDANLPGVYLLALDKKPNSKVNAEDPDIKYIGQTCAKGGLRGRWRKFKRSAFGGNRGHSGGMTYNQKRYSKKGLCVAALPIKKKTDEISHAYIRFKERKLIWRYVKKHGHKPPCNKE